MHGFAAALAGASVTSRDSPALLFWTADGISGAIPLPPARPSHLVGRITPLKIFPFGEAGPMQIGA